MYSHCVKEHMYNISSYCKCALFIYCTSIGLLLIRRWNGCRVKNKNVFSHERVTLSEVQTAVRQYKNKKSPGPDGVTTEILTHVDNSAIWTLLKVYSHSWSFRTLIHIWREAIILYQYILTRGTHGSQTLPIGGES